MQDRLFPASWKPGSHWQEKEPGTLTQRCWQYLYLHSSISARQTRVIKNKISISKDFDIATEGQLHILTLGLNLSSFDWFTVQTNCYVFLSVSKGHGAVNRVLVSLALFPYKEVFAELPFAPTRGEKTVGNWAFRAVWSLTSWLTLLCMQTSLFETQIHHCI